MTTTFPPATIGYGFSHAHLLGIEPLSPGEIAYLLDRASSFADLAPNEAINEAQETLEGSTVINLFFENSTRTRSSFEIAAQRLGADVVNMDVATSSVKKGETLIDTADTLNAMRPDFLVVRHDQAGAVKLLSRKLDAHVLNGGDGKHEHPTQALADALVMHPGPMNRGVEIASDIADDLDQSVIREQVEMGVAVRMACFEALATRRGPTTLRAA